MGSVILAGVDTLSVGFNVDEYDLTNDEWAYLADAKQSAQGAMFDGGGQPVTVRGHSFSMSPKGGRGYEYVLENDDLRVQFAARAEGGKHFPEINVRFSSAYLWRCGWQAAFFYVDRWIRQWAIGESHIVSRVDLCLDMAEGLPDVDIHGASGPEVVTFAQTKTDFAIERRMQGILDTGFRFGQGKLMCRIYDKIAEIAHSDKLWFFDLWKNNGWTGDTAVTRVEFQARRTHLKSQQITTIYDLESQMADLWRYFCKGWLSLRDQTGDTNRRRWPVKPFWKTVQGAISYFGSVTGVRRLTQRAPKLDKMGQLARGLLASMAALYQTTTENEPSKVTMAGAIAFLQYRVIPEWISDPAFNAKVEKKIARMTAFA